MSSVEIRLNALLSKVSNENRYLLHLVAGKKRHTSSVIRNITEISRRERRELERLLDRYYDSQLAK